MEVRSEVLSRDSPSADQSAQTKGSGLYHCSRAGLFPPRNVSLLLSGDWLRIGHSGTEALPSWWRRRPDCGLGIWG